MKIPVYSINGKVVGEQELDPKVFAVTGKPELVQQTVVAEQANARQVLGHTKIRSEVRGGGKKPWKQKGTGRARQGSIRSPQWRGGGVVFGPRKDRNFSVRINKKMKRKALLMILSDKVARKRLLIIDDFNVSGKTKDFAKTMAALWPAVEAKTSKTKSPSALIMVSTIPDALKQSTKNVPRTEAIRTDSLNVTTLLKHDYALTTKDGVKALEAWLTGKKTSKK